MVKGCTLAAIAYCCEPKVPNPYTCDPVEEKRRSTPSKLAKPTPTPLPRLEDKKTVAPKSA
jgi:hypothetical protein